MNTHTKPIQTRAATLGGSFHFPATGEDGKTSAAVNGIPLTEGTLAVIHARRQAATTRLPDPDLSVPERGTTGPVHIGEVMEPIRRIIAHPDRNRLIAEFCKRHW